MIQTQLSTSEISAALTPDFIANKTPLTTSAGFAPGSEFAGQPRQTVTLVLSEDTITAIRAQIKELYQQIIKDCWPEGSPLPFDMVRFDAFLLPETNEIKIIELNTRNVGLHEVVEWLDTTVAAQLNIAPVGSLNRRFVENQKRLHDSMFSADEPLLFMSPDFIPRWTYLDELKRAYSDVCHITDAKQAEYTPEGAIVNGYTYKVVTKKMSWPVNEVLKGLDSQNKIRILQPRWMGHFGLKNYLQRLSGASILRTESFDPSELERYQNHKDELVLKVIDGGGSKSIYLGAAHSDAEWAEKLMLATAAPEKWVLQDYQLPPQIPVIAHGKGQTILPTQLGIFVLPCVDDPTNFDMDITVKAYAGPSRHFTFDPSGLNPDIWFGHVVKQLG